MIRHGPALVYGVQPYLGSSDAFPEQGPDRRGSLTGRTGRAIPRGARILSHGTASYVLFEGHDHKLGDITTLDQEEHLAVLA